MGLPARLGWSKARIAGKMAQNPCITTCNSVPKSLAVPQALQQTLNSPTDARCQQIIVGRS